MTVRGGTEVPVAKSAGEPAQGLRRFLVWFTPIVYGFVIVDVAAFLAFGDIATAGAGAVTLAVGLSLTFALLLVRRGRAEPAALVVCVSVLAGVLGGSFVLPHIAASAKLAPVLVIAVALLYLERRHLAGVIVLSGAATIALAVLEEALPQTTANPGWVDQLLRVGALAAIVMATAYLLWLSSARLRGALNQSISANSDLAAAEGRLSEANEELRARVEELQRQNREISVLTEMAELLQASRTADEAYEAISRSGAMLLPDSAGAVHVIKPSRDVVTVVASWGAQPVSRPSFEPQDCWALRRGRAHFSPGGPTRLRCPHLADADPLLASLCIPLIAHSETLGILELIHPTVGTAEPAAEPSPETGELAEGLGVSDGWSAEAAAAFPEDRRRLAMTLAEHTALHVANFRLRETLLTQSTRDPLTGLFNRRFMEESLERELRRAARDETELAVLMLDLDHFKSFNDNHGHAAGDAQLRALAEYLQNHVRAEDVACRYGGEEFTIIMPGASLVDARDRAGLLRVGIRNLSTPSGGATLDPVTVSIGVSVYPLNGATSEELMHAADEALFDAKKRGRDRVRLAAPRT
jgi:diguanylate cyclase (GGDEF)-like protein